MPTLSKDLRRTLENVVADARRIAEAGAEQALKQLAVHSSESWQTMTIEEKALREKLRAHGKQLGDKRESNRTQEIPRLTQACAYEHWHRMLFARFLAENNLLIHPDYGEPMPLNEIKELAREQNADWLSIATSFAQRMLLEVFRPDDPVLDLILPPETRQKLEDKLAVLPVDIFTAEDSLGWVYQFWQSNEKDAINKSEVKIGADELAAVTQLFTEDYMVFFMLHNTLGAWWVAKRQKEGKSHELPGLKWTYLRVTSDGTPAAGAYEAWPRTAKELRILDPCMGSGHFLTHALPILVRMRQEEEECSESEAICAVLTENLFGLELDTRCSQIAAFNLALTAWRLIGKPIPLPPPNVACSGLGINTSEADWVAVSGTDPRAQEAMRSLFKLFSDAPLLGSLIDPTRLNANLFSAEFEQVRPALEQALTRERATDRSVELAIAAKGLLAAAEILSAKYTLVITNVPYRISDDLADPIRHHLDVFHKDSRSDLATAMLDRLNRFCSGGGSAAAVIKHELFFAASFDKFRKRLLENFEWTFVVRLGPRAFETITGEVVNVGLVCLSHDKPSADHCILSLDASNERTPSDKALHIRTREIGQTLQETHRQASKSRISTAVGGGGALLSKVATSHLGICTGDYPRFGRHFWELPSLGEDWATQQSSIAKTTAYGGRSYVLLWEGGRGQFLTYLNERLGEERIFTWLRGKDAWGRRGVLVTTTGDLPCTIYDGGLFDNNVSVLVPERAEDLPGLWALCSSLEYGREVRRINQSLKITDSSLVEIPVEFSRWREEAVLSFASVLPTPHTDDPTQWIFAGHPHGSKWPLQVGLARLVGYRWPRQAGSSFPDCPNVDADALERYVDTDGIVCLASLAGEPTAADKLRDLLAAAYGSEWSSPLLGKLLGDNASLETWLRDRCFEEHCSIFDNRPFVWHIWDGRKDGFHAFVNYHKLAGAHGEGRKILEKLIYTSLGDWIGRQQAEVEQGVDGAEGRREAAKYLSSQLVSILNGEPPYDIFVRWKPIHAQSLGWEPDVNDGVRLNIRPWLTTTLAPHTKPKKGACILRVTPKIVYGKDRGKEPARDPIDFPWFAESTDRNNDIHLGLNEKRAARERRRK